MLLTFDEILDIAEARLECNDFGRWQGTEDDVLRFAIDLLKREKEKEDETIQD